MPVNGQYSDPPFGLGGDYASTGAPGTPTASPESTQGAVLGQVTVSTVYGSSQLPLPVVSVTSGDTSNMSSDGPVPAGGDPMSGVPAAFITSTGAGQGSGHQINPNATGVPSAGAQVAQARRPS